MKKYFSLLILFTVLLFAENGNPEKIYNTIQDSSQVTLQQDQEETIETGTSVPRWVVFAFLFIVLIILIIVVTKIDRFKFSVLEKRKERLEALVHERTVDLLKEKEKVEKLLEQSEKAKQELQSANDIKTKLLDIAAHDLKNPLQAILGFEYLLKENDTTSEDIDEMCASIFRSSKRMLSIVKDLLESSATDTTQLVIKTEIYKISNLIREIFYNNKIRAVQKSQNIHLDLDESIYGEVDPLWMGKAIDNLLSNAIKYSEYDKNIWVSLYKEGNKIFLRVRDEGPGISEEEREQLFEKFLKLSNQPTDGEFSTGLGLYIAKEIINKHDGEIIVESELKEGSSFIIILPALS